MPNEAGSIVTLGGTVTVGNTTGNTAENNIILSAQFTMPATGQAKKMGINIYSYTAGAKVVLGLYADNGDTPVGGAKLGQTNEITIAQTGWTDVDLQSPVNLVGGTKYWMAVETNGTNKNLYYSTGNSPSDQYVNVTYSATMPNPYPSGTSATSSYFNERMTYAEYFTQTVSDILGMVDSVPTKATYYKMVSEILGMVDSVPTKASFKQLVSEILGMSDSVSSKRAFKQAVSEVLGMVDSVVRSRGVPITISEILGLRDSIEKRKKVSKAPDLPDHTIEGGAAYE